MSAHGWWPDSCRDPLISERKLLTTKLRSLENAFMQRKTLKL